MGFWNTKPAKKKEPAKDKDGNLIPEPKKGLDKFQEIMDNANKARKAAAEANKGKEPPKPITANSFMTAENKKALAESVDFTKAISEETATKLASGDSSAIMLAMQEIGRHAYMTALEQATVLTDTAVQANQQDNTPDIQAVVAQQLQHSKINEQIPGSDNPILQMGIEQFKEQMLAANPEATPEEVATTVREYVKELNANVNPDPIEEKPDTVDSVPWAEWAELDEPQSVEK